ncbi:ABC transporter permease [Mucilaginibacter myungsuensis]|uniref:ABC transporter permease n=1 Tax=Mucilaginibacter myungsuensis TaxID=649104 RepID=A0A929KXN9_9SPHI|nr:ABC transporter permease [Mucilaginibacter myungsuensis]MBE9660809.1 ABC transporter permease [Mucilaginibacter myungsuensis]MDN3600855.1 ABC transporter permease [Mucilaginibacter myungsuensis]
MLKNYFKIAIAVLKRRKFFTFISLFGISFTLTILLVLAAFIDKAVNDTYPDRKRNRSLYANKLELRGKESMNSSSLSYYFINEYVSKLKTPVNIGISTRYESTNTYVNNRKVVIDYKYTNAAFWDILEFEFIEGKAITKQQVDNAEHVAVITEALKKEYFGDGNSPVIGKYIEADNVKYRVCGVVKDLPVISYLFYSNIYLPITTSKTKFNTNKDWYMGNFNAILLAKDAADVPKMQKEYADMIAKLTMPDKQFDRINGHADTYLQGYVRSGNEERSGMLYAILTVTLFALFVMLLPTLNLVNINVTRIMERSSEIGVRKAFGASSKTLVYQFIVENLILTFFGGAIGIVLTVLVLYYINSANFIANLDLTVNFTVLGYAMLACLVFGLVSGVYPAWRMSKLNIVKALKA